MDKKSNFEAGFSSDAVKNPRRIVFITKKHSAKVKGEVGPQLMSYPHLLLRESIVLQILVITLVAISLFWDAPLEQLADPLLTPNPAKAPWYFLGLHELLHYFPPTTGGVLVPGLVLTALAILPYVDRNPSRAYADRKVAIVTFTMFLIFWAVVTLSGSFFRGPGWLWVWPWVHMYFNL